MSRRAAVPLAIGKILPQTQNPEKTMSLNALSRSLLAGVALAMLLGISGRQAHAQSASAIPSLGGDMMEIRTERKLGDRIARDLYRDPDFIDDVLLEYYVEAIWRRLIEAARRRGDLPEELYREFSWKILLGKDRTINAFALPGGYFGLHLGMIAAIESSSELAAVLAHELAHASQRHLYRLTVRQERLAPWMIGAFILGTLAATRNPDAANAIVLGGQAAGLQTQLNFSRDMEREADRIALGILQDAGFATSGMVSMFEKLQSANQLNDSGAFPYLRTHPLTTDRIGDMRARIGISGSGGKKFDLEASLMATRASILSRTSASNTNQLPRVARNQATNPKEQLIVHRYGTALGATLSGERDNSELILPEIDERDRDTDENAWLIHLVWAELDLNVGRYADANERLTRLTRMPEPGKRPVLLLKIQSMLGKQTDESRKRARELLRLWLSEHSDDAAAWQLMVKTQTELNEPIAAIRAEAEVRMVKLDYVGALDRYKAAIRLSTESEPVLVDQIELAVVETRLRDAQAKIAEQEADQRKSSR